MNERVFMKSNNKTPDAFSMRHTSLESRFVWIKFGDCINCIRLARRQLLATYSFIHAMEICLLLWYEISFFNNCININHGSGCCMWLWLPIFGRTRYIRPRWNWKIIINSYHLLLNALHTHTRLIDTFMEIVWLNIFGNAELNSMLWTTKAFQGI